MTASDRNHVKKSGAWVLRAGRDPTSPAEPNEESLCPDEGARGPVPRGRDTTETCRRTPIGVLSDPLSPSAGAAGFSRSRNAGRSAVSPSAGVACFSRS